MRSIDPTVTIWGTPAERTGLLTAVVVLVVVAAARAAGATLRRWTVVGCAVASVGGALVPGFFASPEELAWVALMGGGLAAWSALEERSRLHGAVALGMLAVAIMVGGPSALVGLWFGGAIALAVVREEAELSPATKRVLTVAFVAVVFLPVAALAMRAYALLAEGATTTRVVERIAAEPDLFVRGSRWWAGVDAGRARPLVGAGSGCFVYAWDYFFPARVLDIAPRFQDVEDAGSLFLTAFAERGALGAAAELLLLVAAFRAVTRRRRAGELGVTAATTLAALVVARAGQGLLAGPDVSGLVLTGVLVGLCVRPVPRERTSQPVPAARQLAGIALAVLAVVPGFATSVIGIGGAARFETLSNVPLDPLAGHARIELAQRVASEVTEDTPDARVDAAFAALDARLAVNDRDVRSARALADLAVAASNQQNREDLLEPALERLEAATEWAPTRADLSVRHYDILHALGRDAEATEWVDDAYALAPDWSESIWRYAEDAVREGRTEDARTLIENARAAGHTFVGRGCEVADRLLR